MRIGTGKALIALALLAAVTAAGPPTAAAATPGVNTSVWSVRGDAASAASPLNVLTISDERGIDNRITAYLGPTGRLVLTAPEGLGDPDGGGANCSLDGATPGQSSAQEVSCAPGYIGTIVGDLGGGRDVFNADPGLPVLIGAVVDGRRRSLSGGRGRDRLVGGAAQDLLEGAGGADAIVGSGDKDLLVGGPGADKVNGGGGNDTLVGLGGPDRLNGTGGRDVCRGGGGTDRAKSCELTRGIP